MSKHYSPNNQKLEYQQDEYQKEDSLWCEGDIWGAHSDIVAVNCTLESVYDIAKSDRKSNQEYKYYQALLIFNILVSFFSFAIVTHKGQNSCQEKNQVNSRHDQGKFRYTIARNVVVFVRITI